jgi:hypothetical protein
MRVLDETPHMADTFGVPTYYVTDVVTENAGGGNLRIWNCEMRNGLLIPRCEIISPAMRILSLGRAVSDFAQRVFQDNMMDTGKAH